MMTTGKFQLAEFGRIWRFGIVGVLATLVHLIIVWNLIHFDFASPLLANLIAFLIAFSVSFVGHYRWSFGSSSPKVQALFRFASIAAIGFLINSCLLSVLIWREMLLAEWAAVVSTFVVPPCTYLLSRFWGFKS